MIELQKKELLLLKIITKKEDQAMDPDIGITKKTLHTDPIPNMDRIIRTVDARLTDDQINSPTETMNFDRITDITKTKTELGKTTAIFLVRHSDKDGTFLKVIFCRNPRLFNLEIRHLDDQTVTQTLVPLLTNKNFRKPTIKHQRTWFDSPPLMIALTNYRKFVR